MLELRFGKYNRKTVEQVFFTDPGYVWWMHQQGFHNGTSKFKLRADEQQRLQTLIRRARHLRIPGTCTWCKDDKPVTRMFLTQHTSGGLARVDFDCENCTYGGGSRSIALKPGFYTPDIYRGYDKTGGKFLVQAIKYAFFGDESYRITKKRAEDFFNNPQNFVNF